MTKTLTVAVALASGFLGSMLTRYVAPPAAFAQNQPAAKPAQEIRAQSFTIVDRSDHTIATFEFDRGDTAHSYGPPYGPRIVLRDAGGRVLWSASPTSLLQPLSQR